MKAFSINECDFNDAFGIAMSSIGGNFPTNEVNTSYGKVSVSGKTDPHSHDESEAFIILSGVGSVQTDKDRLNVKAGDVVFFDPFETHCIINDGSDELHFLDIYWRSSGATERAVKKITSGEKNKKPTYVFSTPPTPNGDLHLGHLSGPYLGADVYVRFQRMLGNTTFHLTGSDDFQSYVVDRAQKDGKSPKEVANFYGNLIQSTLELMDIQLDSFLRTSKSQKYEKFMRSIFNTMIGNGLTRSTHPALVNTDTGEFLYEVAVSGNCPNCSEECGGNICEQCGYPNRCFDLIEPRSGSSPNGVKVGEGKSYVIPVSKFQEAVLGKHNETKLPPKLRKFVSEVLADESLLLPVTQYANWGIRPHEVEQENQVIWVWLEMAFGFLFSINEIANSGKLTNGSIEPQDDWKIVHFFGFDNSFYHSVLFPIAYEFAFPDWKYNIEYNVNEFYLLDSKKFSTSRRHVIWGKQILNEKTVDAVRYYLALTRPENERKNFSIERLRTEVDQMLIGKWQLWLHDLGKCIDNEFSSSAPDSGKWSAEQIGFLEYLRIKKDNIKLYYSAVGYSLNKVTSELNELIEGVTAFNRQQECLRTAISLRDHYRTSIALQLRCACLLASACAPLMPRFAMKLSNALGQSEISNWEDEIEFVEPGTLISLSGVSFFDPEMFSNLNLEIDTPVSV